MQGIYPVEGILWLMVALVGVKVLLAVALALLASWVPSKAVDAYFVKMTTLSKKAAPKSDGKQRGVWRSTLRSCRRPLFLLSVVSTAVVVYFLDSAWAPAIWAAMRPLGVAFIVLLTLRLLVNIGAAQRLSCLLPKRFRATLSHTWQNLHLG